MSALIESAKHQRKVDPTPLRAAINTYVHELKDAGLPPERVIIVIKAMANDGVSTTYDPSSPSLPPGMADKIVTWSIVAYYNGD